MGKEKMNIDKVKGRPVLHWVGKKPIEKVYNYPAQLVETYGEQFSDNEFLDFKQCEKNWQNLIFHGDNKEILSALIVNGFRGKIDLIYIDPPFDSSINYVRDVKLRGTKNNFAGEAQNIIEQTQYTDIWVNDQYLQFMYERLILLRELLSDKGSIYLHCDWHKSHHLRFLLDEVFGEENFVNEIIWQRAKTAGRMSAEKQIKFDMLTDNIFLYSKTKGTKINKQKKRVYYTEEEAKDKFVYDSNEKKYYKHAPKGNYSQQSIEEFSKDGRIYWTSNNLPRIKTFLSYEKINDVQYIVDVLEVSNLWTDISDMMHIPKEERTNYPTQKPEDLLMRIIGASSNENSIILDCFGGAGTTANVAQKLNRRWIVADLNKGAIQTTSKRLQATIKQQSKNSSKNHYSCFKHYHVNNYCFQKHQQAVSIITGKYSVELNKSDIFFDGILGDDLVKICELNRPATMLDIQAIKDELGNRSDETRNIRFFVSGVEFAVINEVERYNKTRPINKINITDIQRDGVMIFEPAEAEIAVVRKGKNAKITINNYLSPTILKRLDIDRSLFGERITDFKAQIDVVLIDNNYNGKIFNIYHSDIPEKKENFIIGEYEITTPTPKAKIAIKIIDMVGEEFLFIDE